MGSLGGPGGRFSKFRFPTFPLKIGRSKKTSRMPMPVRSHGNERKLRDSEKISIRLGDRVEMSRRANSEFGYEKIEDSVKHGTIQCSIFDVLVRDPLTSVDFKKLEALGGSKSVDFDDSEDLLVSRSSSWDEKDSEDLGEKIAEFKSEVRRKKRSARGGSREKKRKFESFNLHNDKPWMCQLVAVACLSLAAKVEETKCLFLMTYK
ncbi:hypothetical protein ACET3Z_003097 [Daucus carota]